MTESARDEFMRETFTADVESYVAAQDWGALLRYWLAHRCDFALTAAASIVFERAKRHNGEWHRLRDFLALVQNDPFTPNQFDVRESDPWNSVELASLLIVNLFPYASLCERAVGAEPEEHQRLLELGIEAAQKAVTVSVELDDRPLLALFIGLLGVAYTRLNRIEQARSAFELVHREYIRLFEQQPDMYRFDVAATLINLGICAKSQGELSTASSCFSDATRMFRELSNRWPGGFDDALASALNNLGSIERNPSEAESHLSEALSIRQQLAQPESAHSRRDLATSLVSLAGFWFERREYGHARQRFAEALHIYEDLNDVHDVAAQLMNLGTTYQQENRLEEAREKYAEALAIEERIAKTSPDAYETQMAGTLINLGLVHRDLGDADRACETIERAVRLLRRTIDGTEENSGVVLAVALHDLGVAQTEATLYDAAQRSFTEAITLYRDYKELHASEYQSELARSIHALGSVERALGNTEAADKCFAEALSIRNALSAESPEVYATDLGESLAAVAEQQLSANKYLDAVESYEAALELYEKDSEVRPTACLLQRLNGWGRLGNLHWALSEGSDVEHIQKARHALRRSLAVTEIFRGQLLDPDQRKRILEVGVEYAELLFQAEVEMWFRSSRYDDLAAAFESAEAMRARTLLELLADEELTPNDTPRVLVEKVRSGRRLYREAKRRFLEAQIEADKHVGEADASNHPDNDLERLEREADRLQGHYEETLAIINRQCDADFNPDRPVRPIGISETLSLIPDDVPTAIVQLSLSQTHTVAMIISRDTQKIVRLDRIDDKSAEALARLWFRGYDHRGDVNVGFGEFTQFLSQFLRRLSADVACPIEDALRDDGYERLIIVPHRHLHLFPLHACHLKDGQLLGDKYEITYAPSVSILAQCSRRARGTASRLVCLTNPTSDLAFAEFEAVKVSSFYSDVTFLQGGDVRKEWILKQMPPCDVLHYSGHARFEKHSPLDSSIMLRTESGESETLTLRDIFCGLHLPETQLVILGACESGMLEPDIVDDHVGLPTGFLYAGAACVISAMWSIDDLPTALLLNRFHEEWQDGQQIGSALREAQRWLRDGIRSGRQLVDFVSGDDFFTEVSADIAMWCKERARVLAHNYPDSPPFESPVYWAPFVAQGAAYPVHSSLD